MSNHCCFDLEQIIMDEIKGSRLWCIEVRTNLGDAWHEYGLASNWIKPLSSYQANWLVLVNQSFSFGLFGFLVIIRIYLRAN